MKKIMTAMVACSLVMGVSACGGMAGESSEASAAAGISGSWLIDVNSAQFENNVDRYVLADGQYSCESCQPAYSVPADGEWHSVELPGTDSVMVEVLDDNTVRTASRRGDKDLGGATWTVAEDGQSMSIDWTNLDGDAPVTGSATFVRAEAAPEGAHAMSGGWTVGDIASMDAAGLTIDISVEGDQYTNSGNGQSYTATLGGDPVAIEGDAAGTMVMVEQTGDNSYRETYMLDGETTSILEVSVDGDTMSAVSTDPRDGSVVRWTAARQ